MKHKVNTKNKNTFVECKICKKKLSRISASHLKTHNITTKEYISKFNISKGGLTCKDIRDNCSVTKNKMIEKYGAVEGNKKWDSYINKQRETNTFEYKKKKYGWKEQDFKEYNASRAVTKENLIKRHGPEMGLNKWEDYIRKQTSNGCTLEWFVSKLGYVEGHIKYNEINSKKALTLENFINKYGEDGVRKFKEFKTSQNKRIKFFSDISQELFENIDIQLKNKKTYFKNKNKEFGIYLNTLKKYIFLDFYDITSNKCIEFYGDYWHCNPDIYVETFEHPHLGKNAEDIRKEDSARINALKKEAKIPTLIIWEMDYNKDKQLIVKQCLDFLNNEI